MQEIQQLMIYCLGIFPQIKSPGHSLSLETIQRNYVIGFGKNGSNSHLNPVTLSAVSLLDTAFQGERDFTQTQMHVFG